MNLPRLIDSEYVVRTAVNVMMLQDAGCAKQASGTSTAWPSANLAIFTPFFNAEPRTVAQLFVVNGTGVSGNIDVGLYAIDGTRLASAGSTAQAGTSAVQAFNITDIRLPVGTYYMAVALDNNTGAVEGAVPTSAAGAAMLRIAGCAQMAAAFPLPATATLASITNNLLPSCGFTRESVI